MTNTTVNLMFGLRALDPDAAKAMALVKQVKVYPYSARANPPATRLITANGKKWFGGPPRGRVPAKPPAKNFWSATVYDIGTRCLIDNKQRRADRGSRDELKLNADGSVDLYFGPKPPKSGEDNWVQTIPGLAWFLYFRFYGPLEPYFDKSWKMPDIEKVK